MGIGQGGEGKGARASPKTTTRWYQVPTQERRYMYLKQLFVHQKLKNGLCNVYARIRTSVI